MAISVGPGLGVDADLRAAQPLGGGDVDVAGPGDHVDRRQLGAVGVGAAVGQQRHRLRAADRPHLVDAEQPRPRPGSSGAAGRRMRPAAGWPPPASRPRRPAPGTTFITTLDGYTALPPGTYRPTRSTGTQRSVTVAPGHQLGGGVGAPLVGVHRAGPLDRHLQRGAHRRVQLGQRGRQRGGRHPDRGRPDAVELLAEFQRRRRHPRSRDRLDDRPHLRQHRVHVHPAARQGGAQLGSRQFARRAGRCGPSGAVVHVVHCPRAVQVVIATLGKARRYGSDVPPRCRLCGPDGKQPERRTTRTLDGRRNHSAARQRG